MSLRLYTYAVMIGVFSLSALAAAQPPFPDIHTQSAHVHGVAHLAVAVEGNTLVIELEVPLENLIGFERKPTRSWEMGIVSRASKKLDQPSLLFKFSDDADCSVTSAQAKMPFLEDNGHREADARYQFICKSIDRLQSIEMTIFKTFSHIETIKMIYIDDERQLAKTLTHDQPVFSLH